MISIWQIFFDDKSYACIDSGFIPYNNSNKCTVFFENEVIYDIYKTKKHILDKSEYIGVLSWRFKEKSGLTSRDIFNKIYKDKKDKISKDIYLLTPKKYMGLVHTTHKTSFESVTNICNILDKENILPFKMHGDNIGCTNFCNFWICKKDVFYEYMETCFIPLYNFMENCKCRNFLDNIKKITPYRNCTPHTFIFESLFKYFVDYKNIPFDYINDSNSTVLKCKAFGKSFNIDFKDNKLILV